MAYKFLVSCAILLVVEQHTSKHKSEHTQKSRLFLFCGYESRESYLVKSWVDYKIITFSAEDVSRFGISTCCIRVRLRGFGMKGKQLTKMVTVCSEVLQDMGIFPTASI